jgi:dienelactone hydrolase
MTCAGGVWGGRGAAVRLGGVVARLGPARRNVGRCVATISQPVLRTHLLAPKIKARMYFGVASNDDARQPDAKDKLKEAFAAAKVPAEIEVYAGALHGWCVPDMPMQNGTPIYNKPEAERAWAKLIALYKAALA